MDERKCPESVKDLRGVYLSLRLQIPINKIDAAARNFGALCSDRALTNHAEIDHLVVSFRRGFYDEIPTHELHELATLTLSPTVFPFEYSPQPRETEEDDAKFVTEFLKRFQTCEATQSQSSCEDLKEWAKNVVNGGLCAVLGGKHRLEVRR
jgi:hypothetical protein